MTVDIAAVAEQARRVQVEPFGASVGHSAAAVWEKAARALAQERDALAAQLADETREEWGTRHFGSPVVDLRLDEMDARQFALQTPFCDIWRRTVHTGPWVEVAP